MEFFFLFEDKNTYASNRNKGKYSRQNQKKNQGGGGGH